MAREVALHGKEGIVGYARVDDADYDLVAQFRWLFDKKGYVVSRTPRPENKRLKMHRLILGVTDPKIQVDHRDRNKVNNQRSNLRLATNAENHQNMSGGWGSTGVRGVTWDKSRGKYIAGVKINYKRHNLGRFDTLEEAARVAADFRAKNMPFSEEAARV